MQPTAAEEPRQRHALYTLRNKDFALLWSGQLVSVIGDQMQQVAIGWHLYLLTNSPVQLGLVGLARVVPFLTLSLMGGALADSMDRRRLLWFSNGVQAVVTCGLAAATVTGRVSPQLIYAVTFIQGAASAFDSPTRQAMIPTIVPRREMANAMTLFTLMRGCARVVGPGIGGLVIAQFGLGWTYAGNAISFVIVAAVVAFMTRMPIPASNSSGALERLAGGWRYAQHQPLVLLPLSLDAFRGLILGLNTYTVIFARDIFNVGPEGLGTMRTAIAAGAVTGGLLLGTGRLTPRPVPVMIAGYSLEAAGMLAMGLAPTFGLAVAVLFFNGVGNVMGEVMRNTLVQLKTPDEVRGRVSALGQMATQGAPQLGQMQAGLLINAVGPAPAVIANGLTVVVAALLFGLLPPIRRADREGVL
jgi:MFS family permease